MSDTPTASSPRFLTGETAKEQAFWLYVTATHHYEQPFLAYINLNNWTQLTPRHAYDTKRRAIDVDTKRLELNWQPYDADRERDFAAARGKARKALRLCTEDTVTLGQPEESLLPHNDNPRLRDVAQRAGLLDPLDGALAELRQSEAHLAVAHTNWRLRDLEDNLDKFGEPLRRRPQPGLQTIIDDLGKFLDERVDYGDEVLAPVKEMHRATCLELAAYFRERTDELLAAAGDADGKPLN